MSMKRANPFNSIFSGGTGSRPNPITNGHPTIWSNRAIIQSSPSVTIGPADQVRLPAPPPPDVFQDREGGGGMRVGRDFQARIPAHIPNKDKFVQQESERALLVWSPCPSNLSSDADINAYLKVAKEKFNYSGEQALGLLYWHHFSIPKALEDLGNFTPHPEEWTIEDKILFEQAFQFHGKAFDRIRQMLPDKSMSSLIRYYYKWKKTRNKSSIMDRQSKRFSQEDGEDSVSGASSVSNATASQSASHNPNASSNYSISLISQRQPAVPHSDSDDDIIKKQNGESGKSCGNCGVPCTELHTKDNLCNTCYLYWKKTGDYRPLTGPLRRGDRQLLGLFRQKCAPPSGMYINHDDLTILASAPPQAENVIVQGLEKDVIDSKCSVQSMKQKIEILKRKLPSFGKLQELKPKKLDALLTQPRINARWTQEELMLAAQGVRLYGKNFSKIVEVIPTKAEAHIKSFYVNYRRRFGLDDLVKEQELDALQDDLDQNGGCSVPGTPEKITTNVSGTVAH